MEEAYSIALRNALNEVRNIFPDIKCSFLFDENGKFITGDEKTDEKTVRKASQSIDDILEKAESIGGLETIAINGSERRVQISRVDNMYLTMVTPKKADMTYIRTIARVIIPTVIKLMDNISSTPLKPFSPPPKQEQKEENEGTSAPPYNQLIVKTISGLFTRFMQPNRVEIDEKILTEWSQGYNEGKEVEEVEVESLGGKKTRCEVEEIQDFDLKDKGLVRMPEKIQMNLGVKEGEQVRVKPVLP